MRGRGRGEREREREGEGNGYLHVANRCSCIPVLRVLDGGLLSEISTLMGGGWSADGDSLLKSSSYTVVWSRAVLYTYM